MRGLLGWQPTAALVRCHMHAKHYALVSRCNTATTFLRRLPHPILRRFSTPLILLTQQVQHALPPCLTLSSSSSPAAASPPPDLAYRGWPSCKCTQQASNTATPMSAMNATAANAGGARRVAGQLAPDCNRESLATAISKNQLPTGHTAGNKTR